MGLNFENLDVARAFMVEEIDMDVKSETIYLSTYLTPERPGNWPDLLRAAALNGDDDLLATSVAGMLNSRIKEKAEERRLPAPYLTRERGMEKRT